MFHSDKKPFYQSATTLFLEPIEIYIMPLRKSSSPSQASNYRRKPSITSMICSEVSLFHVHRVLHDCYYYMEEGETCTKKEAESFSVNYISECGTKIKEILSGISEHQKELLYAVSSEVNATGITSASFIKRHNLKSASAVQSA